MTISALTPYDGTNPNRNTDTRALFSAHVDVLIPWLTGTLITTLNTFVSEVNSVATQVSNDALSTQDAEAILASAILIVNASVWISGTTYTVGSVRWSPTNFLRYARKTDGGGTVDPASDPTNWKQLDPLPDHTGNSGKILSTNGTSALWSVLKTFHGLSLLGSGDIVGDMIVFTSSGNWVATRKTAKITVIGGGQGSKNTTPVNNGGESSFSGFIDSGYITFQAVSNGQGYAGISGGINGYSGDPTPTLGGASYIQPALAGPGAFGSGAGGSTYNGKSGSYVIRMLSNLVIGNTYQIIIGAGGSAGAGGFAGGSGVVIIEL